jgi:hypothetical protein
MPVAVHPPSAQPSSSPRSNGIWLTGTLWIVIFGWFSAAIARELADVTITAQILIAIPIALSLIYLGRKAGYRIIMPVADSPPSEQPSSAPRGSGTWLAGTLWGIIFLWFSAVAVRDLLHAHIVVQVLITATVIAEIWQCGRRRLGHVTPFATAFFTITFASYNQDWAYGIYHSFPGWAYHIYHSSFAWADHVYRSLLDSIRR